MPLHIEVKVVYGGDGCENWLVEGNSEPSRSSGDSILAVEAVAGVAPEDGTFVRCGALNTLGGAVALSLVVTNPAFRPLHGQSVSLTLSSLAPLPVYRVRALGSLLVTPSGSTGSQLARTTHVRGALYALRGHVVTIGCPIMVSSSSSGCSGVPPIPTLTTSCLPTGYLGRVTAQTVVYTPRDAYPAWLTLPRVRSRGGPAVVAAAAASTAKASWSASATVSAEAFLLQVRDQQALGMVSRLLHALRRRQGPGVGARVLLDGPRGCGKTSLLVGAVLATRETETAYADADAETEAEAEAEAEEAPRLVVVSCRQLTTLEVGDGGGGGGGGALCVGGALQRRINLAVALAPSVLLLDAVDCLVKTEGAVDDVAQLLATDPSLAGADVMVVGTCESAPTLPARLRGLFTEEVSVAMPTREERWAAARLLRPRVCVPRALARGVWQVEAGEGALPAGQSSVPTATTAADFFSRADKRIGDATAGQPFVTMVTSIARALARERIVAPSAVGGVGAGADTDADADSDTDAGGDLQVGRWVSGDTTLHGHDAAKASITELLVWPQTHAHAFKALKVSSPLGILLYGPPGTGKTLLARVLAQQQGRAFLVVPLARVVRGEVGAGERALWETFAEAKRRAPSVVFIDEFQAAFTSRSGGGDGGGESGTGALLTAALAACMDDVERWNAVAGPASSVTMLAATNEPWAVDVGFLRPGRLDRTLYVGTLEVGARRALLTEALALRGSGGEGRVVNGGEETGDAEAVAVCGMTAGFTGADLSLLVQRASLDVLRATTEGAGAGAGPTGVVTWACLLAVLQRAEVKPSVTWLQEDGYHKWGKARY